MGGSRRPRAYFCSGWSFHDFDAPYVETILNLMKNDLLDRGGGWIPCMMGWSVFLFASWVLEFRKSLLPPWVFSFFCLERLEAENWKVYSFGFPTYFFYYTFLLHNKPPRKWFVSRQCFHYLHFLNRRRGPEQCVCLRFEFLSLWMISTLYEGRKEPLGRPVVS